MSTIQQQKALKPGDTIGIISPSSPADVKHIRNGINLIEKAGFKAKRGALLLGHSSSGLFSGSVQERVAEIHDMWRDPDVNAFIIADGGFGAAQLLTFLDYDLFSKFPKILMGFSDATALTNALYARSNIVTFDGPVASVRSGEKGRGDTDGLMRAIGLLQDTSSWDDRSLKLGDSLIRTVNKGKARGVAIGGNLTTFAYLIGSPYLPNVDDAILFLEDTSIGGYELWALLEHLELSGIMDRVAGVVLGEFSKLPKKVDPGDPSIDDVISKFFTGKVPCLSGFNFSHGDVAGVIPIGCIVSIDADARTLSFEAPLK